jgi:hypothetical protein
MAKDNPEEMASKADPATPTDKTTLLDLQTDANLWYKVHVLIYDLCHIKAIVPQNRALYAPLMNFTSAAHTLHPLKRLWSKAQSSNQVESRKKLQTQMTPQTRKSNTQKRTQDGGRCD